jgi:hypothetical protein
MLTSTKWQRHIKRNRRDICCEIDIPSTLPAGDLSSLSGAFGIKRYVGVTGILAGRSLVACRREIVSMGFGEKIGLNGWHPPCVNLLSAFGCGGRSNIFSATGH